MPLQLVGHRGAAGILPENTLPGFQHAIDLGMHAVECDVHLTHDDLLVVIHDDTVDRTTNGTGAVRDLDFAALRKLDAGDGATIPTLEEVLAITQGKVLLLCELKGEGVVDAAVDTVLSLGLADQVLFTAFDPNRLESVKRRDTALRTGAILWDPTDADIDRALDLSVEAVAIHYRNLCLRMVEQVRDAGITLRAWNPDTEPEIRAVHTLGVTSISSNRPDRLAAFARSVAK
jgi:glycerophosphoryl diester phosphodiesterase